VCELKVYMVGNDHEELVMEDVANIIPEGDTVVLMDILGQRKSIKARILEIRLLDHKVFLGP